MPIPARRRQLQRPHGGDLERRARHAKGGRCPAAGRWRRSPRGSRRRTGRPRRVGHRSQTSEPDNLAGLVVRHALDGGQPRADRPAIRGHVEGVDRAGNLQGDAGRKRGSEGFRRPVCRRSAGRKDGECEVVRQARGAARHQSRQRAGLLPRDDRAEGGGEDLAGPDPAVGDHGGLLVRWAGRWWSGYADLASDLASPPACGNTSGRRRGSIRRRRPEHD